MNRFAVGHGVHPQWPQALQQATAPLRAAALQPTLGWAYFSDPHAAQAPALWAALQAQWPGVAWVGCSGVGVLAEQREYLDTPAIVLMLCELPRDQFRVFSGARPLRPAADFSPAAALVHADPDTPDLAALIDELSLRMQHGELFGGLASARQQAVQLADGVWQGGLSGVAFAASVARVTRLTQGCRPVGPARRISTVERNLVLRLDDQPALDVLLDDLNLDRAPQRLPRALPRLRETLVGLCDAQDTPFGPGGEFGDRTRVRPLLGIDPAGRGVALGEAAEPGTRLTFCHRDAATARRDLVRVATQVRDDIESADGPPQRMLGALYISCASRGGPYFGGPSAELATLRQALPDVPLVGFFAAGEIAGRHLFGHTGVLTVFSGPA